MATIWYNLKGNEVAVHPTSIYFREVCGDHANWTCSYSQADCLTVVLLGPFQSTQEGRMMKLGDLNMGCLIIQ